MKAKNTDTVGDEKELKQFPIGIKFKYDWRKYQQRVLDELEEHLEDNHLHIIAPPGSGKTILGLEVSLRLNKPTLIFAPTIAIRNQWIQRFCELFLQTDIPPDWISRDIKRPSFLTVSTYQGLHAACSGVPEADDDFYEEEIENIKEQKSTNEKTEEIIKVLKAQNIGTIVVDEAHHLKNAWWQSLYKIKNALNPTIVGLTATPPYDVSYNEWKRYIDLNGPVDTEISVPELVLEGDLCPHQDYIYFSQPTVEESEKIEEYRQRIESLFNDIKSDKDLIQSIENHPIYLNPKEQLDWIYTNIEYYSATLIFLNAVGKEVTKEHLEIIGDKKFIIPELNYNWIEVLLTFYLYKDPENFNLVEAHQEKLINKLKRSGAMERRSVNFKQNKKINNTLSSSIGKLESIDSIVDFEHDQLKEDLRMVILTDYIRKEFLIQESENNLKLNKIGVMPIFEQLRRTNNRNIKTGVLTGSLIIIPITALDRFKVISSRYKIEKISTTPLYFDESYVIINLSNKLKHDVVNIITQVFEEGYIEVLVGTKSLLGEGWDAPSINTLVLASFVGSYVLSNQMRGRAIRTERLNLDKTGNIWHLACVDTTADDGGNDMQLLRRRFKSFVGVSLRNESGIENGIGRLGIAESLKTALAIENANINTLNVAINRDQLKRNWHVALKEGTTLVEAIKVPFPKNQSYNVIKSLYYNRTIKYLLSMFGSVLLGFSLEVLQWLIKAKIRITNINDLFFWMMIIGCLGALFFGRLAFMTFRTYIKYRDISEDIHQIGEALLESLIKIKKVRTNYSELSIISHVDDDGAIYCSLVGGTTYENSTYIKSLQEIIGTVDNPRYVIIRRSFFLNVFSQKDYHSVPDIIGRKKLFSEFFEAQWERCVGSCKLVYTRTIEGRKLLLKSRVSSLASEFEEKAERINKWR